MIKECKVILRNGRNIVILFDDVEVQIIGDGIVEDSVFVECKNGKYSIVTEKEYTMSLKHTTKKSNKVVKEIIDSGNESGNEE